MSKVSYREQTASQRFGDWMRELRLEKELPLRVVAEAAEMDLTHLQKIELGQRLPTEEQTKDLAKFFGLNERDTLARRIAERFRQEFEDHPAARAAIFMLAEEAGVYTTGKKNGKGSN
jgi:transcriptional regulator with XRE-family HTH domain